MNVTQARRIARACAASETARLHEQGYVWIAARLRPALAVLETSEHPLAAEGLRALAALDEMNGAWGVAVRRLDAVLTRMPDDTDAQEMRAAAINAAAAVDAVNAPWSVAVADALADFDPEMALTLVEGRAGLLACQWRAAAHGARGDAAAALQAWRMAAACDEPVSLRPTDWYHLADDLFDEPAFWEALVSMSPRFTRCVGAVHESLYEAMRARHDDLDDAFSAALGCMARFHLARTRGDDSAITALAREVEGWSEIG